MLLKGRSLPYSLEHDMKGKLITSFTAMTLGVATIGITPVAARSFGGGGMHFGGSAMHFGGGFAGPRISRGCVGRFGNGAFQRPMVAGRSIFTPGGNRFGSALAPGRAAFARRFHDFDFRHHHHFRNFAFLGAPFEFGYGLYGYGYDGCWRQVWTAYGYQWVNVCYDYAY